MAEHMYFINSLLSFFDYHVVSVCGGEFGGRFGGGFGGGFFAGGMNEI